MSETEKIKQAIETAFSELKDKVVMQREDRLWLDVSVDLFPKLFDYLVKQLDFSILNTITGLDEGAEFGFIYHLTEANNKVMLNLKTKILKDNGSIQSVTGYFPSAASYERELIDLFGARVEGVPAGPRYPLPDDWPAGQYPLRKDWNKAVLEKGGKV
jgi:Ni,Fe-hydrogenase III component G